MVLISVSRVAKAVEFRGRDAGGALAVGQPLEDHVGQRGVLAHEDKHRRTLLVPAVAPLPPHFFPQAAQHGDGMMGPLEHRFGFRVRPFAAAFRRRQPAGLENPLPDIEIAGDLGARAVAHRQLRNLHQPALDGVDQPEIADHPRKRPVRLLADTIQKVRGGRQVHAEVDSAQLVDAIQALDPHRRLGLVRQPLLAVVLVQLVPVLRPLDLDAVGVVGFVVEHQQVLLAAHVAQHAVDQRRIALHVPRAADLERHVLSGVALHHLDLAVGHLQQHRFAGQPARAALGVVLVADADRLRGQHGHARLDHAAPVARRRRASAARRRASW